MMGDVLKVPVGQEEDVVANRSAAGGERAAAVPTVDELLKGLPDHIDYSFRPDAGSDELVITLSESLIRHAMGETGVGRNVLLLMEKSVSYYVLKADMVAKVLRDVAARFSKVIFVGNSRAGYGGILLAGLCAQHDSRRSYYCMAFSPPTQLHPVNENLPDKLLQSRMNGDEGLRRAVERFGNLEFVQSLANLHIVLVYSEKLPEEVAEAARLCAPNIRKYPVPFSLHFSDRMFILRSHPRSTVERRMRQLYRGKVGNSDLVDVWPAKWEKAVDEIVENRWVPSMATLLEEMVSVPLFGEKRARSEAAGPRVQVPDASPGRAVSLSTEVVAAAIEEAPCAASESGVDGGIAEIVRQNFPNHQTPIEDATRFQDLAGWDSVGHVAMMLDVETRFGVSIPAEEMFDVVDVASLKERILGVRWSRAGLAGPIV
jgi:acyl carrier protein